MTRASCHDVPAVTYGTDAGTICARFASTLSQRTGRRRPALLAISPSCLHQRLKAVRSMPKVTLISAWSKKLTNGPK